MAVKDIKKIAVIGAGMMGSGIAQCASQHGYQTTMMDLKDEYIKRAFESIRKTLDAGIKRGKVTKEKAEKIIANIKGTVDLKDAVKDADLIIEAVFEDMDIKKKLFEDLEKFSNPNALFATNTSTLSISEMALSTKRADKFVGLHFFNPAAINKLIEIIPGEKTSYETINTVTELSRIFGKIPIQVKDSPGFAVNRIFVPLVNEACRIVEEGFANIATVENAFKDAFGINMGAFELMNFTGVPIAYHAQTTLYRKFGDFYKPADILKKQVDTKQNWRIEGDVDTEKIESIKNRLYGLVFGISCKIIDEAVATAEDIEKGITVGLRWKNGPFTLMNKIGIEKSYKLVEDMNARYQHLFPIPEILKKQYELKKEWYLRNVKVLTQDRIATVFIDRPEALNALNTKVLTDLECTFYELEQKPDIEIILITGEGTSFVAGADIKEMIPKTPLEAMEFTKLGQRVLKKIEDSSKIVIAAVNGFALGGGCELLLACDIVIASENAKLGLPEVSLGIHPGFGGTQRLPRLIGRNKAKELIFTGDVIDARTAERIGLVNKVVPPGELMDECRALAHKILAKGPVAVRLAKSAINKGLDMNLDAGLAYETESIALTFSTEDKAEGLKAFIEKRKPVFKGK